VSQHTGGHRDLMAGPAAQVPGMLAARARALHAAGLPTAAALAAAPEDRVRRALARGGQRGAAAGRGGAAAAALGGGAAAGIAARSARALQAGARNGAAAHG
jgi:hypothetical protein